MKKILEMIRELNLPYIKSKIKFQNMLNQEKIFKTTDIFDKHYCNSSENKGLFKQKSRTL